MSLAFFSGNEVFWKTRWQPSSADGTTTQNRTLTTYKDTHFDAATDPVEWTGTWADPRFSAPGDGGRPPNSLTGQLFIVNSGSSDMTVPSTYKNLRLWRNTAVANLAAGQSRTLAPGNQMLGYEWDIDADNGFRPRGQFQASSTTVSGVESFTDYGTNTQMSTTQTHHLTMYRAPSGALVFGAGTVQWAWGLDVTNAWANAGPPAGAAPDPVMQQATVNLFADMGAQATTLMGGLTAASASTDTTAPNSTISSPAQDTVISDGITGDDLRHRERHRRHGGRRRGVDRRRHQVASGHRDHVVDVQLERPRLAALDDHGARGRRQRQRRVVLAERERQRRAARA